MDSYKRLYIFTGKGGVGKTTAAVAATSYLKSLGKNVKLAYFRNSKLESNALEFNEVASLAKDSGIDYIPLELLESCRNYIAGKLKSKTIASWVVKTPFFKSLINMIPGFNYLIYMGQILDLLRQDPELIIVLDSPSSGHALTMFEATKNFNQIFSSGVLYNDTETMLMMLRDPSFIKVNILTLPTTLAINEASELVESLKKIESFEVEVICNNTLEKYSHKDLPDFLAHKIENEVKAIDTHQNLIKHTIPFSMAKSTNELVKDLAPCMQNLV